MDTTEATPETEAGRKSAVDAVVMRPSLPVRMEAWDAETDPKGWVVPSVDIETWAKETLSKASGLPADAAHDVLVNELHRLIVHCS